MFKRLFFLSGLIAFLLASALMYFWYIPNHPAEDPATVNKEVELETVTVESDSSHITLPQE